jgi:hypothetical protein
MLKRLGLPFLILAAMLTFATPKPAEARVHFGVVVGAPPVYPYQSCSPYDPYCSPYTYSYPYAYGYPYGYGYQPYVYGGWGWGHRDHEWREHEFREHHEFRGGHEGGHHHH